MEDPAEGAQAVEANFEANGRYAEIRDTKEKHRALHAPALQIAVWGLSKRRMKGTDEMCLGHLRDTRQPANAERFREHTIHRIPRTQHPSIAFFQRSAHNAYFTTDEPRFAPGGAHVTRALYAAGAYATLIARAAVWFSNVR